MSISQSHATMAALTFLRFFSMQRIPLQLLYPVGTMNPIPIVLRAKLNSINKELEEVNKELNSSAARYK